MLMFYMLKSEENPVFIYDKNMEIGLFNTVSTLIKLENINFKKAYHKMFGGIFECLLCLILRLAAIRLDKKFPHYLFHPYGEYIGITTNQKTVI